MIFIYAYFTVFSAHTYIYIYLFMCVSLGCSLGSTCLKLSFSLIRTQLATVYMWYVWMVAGGALCPQDFSLSDKIGMWLVLPKDHGPVENGIVVWKA